MISETLTTDELLDIFLYIISKARVGQIYTHVSLVQIWVQDQERHGFPGYVLSTVLVALEHLAEEGRIIKAEGELKEERKGREEKEEE